MLLISKAIPIIVIVIIIAIILFCLVYPTDKYDPEMKDKEQENFLRKYRKVHTSED